MYRGGPTYNTYVAPPVYGGYGGYGGGISLFPSFVTPIFGFGGEPQGVGRRVARGCVMSERMRWSQCWLAQSCVVMRRTAQTRYMQRLPASNSACSLLLLSRLPALARDWPRTLLVSDSCCSVFLLQASSISSSPWLPCHSCSTSSGASLPAGADRITMSGTIDWEYPGCQMRNREQTCWRV